MKWIYQMNCLVWRIEWTIEYRAMTSQKTLFFFFAFQHFGYHVSVEHDEKHPQPKFGGNQFMVVRDMATWLPNCDIIKGNEYDVVNADFELQA